ncbi:hypothetical protein BH10PSE19_BH10PSE19_22350 [soil metagenome]
MNTETINIKTSSPDIRWVAISIINGDRVIAEGKTPEEASNKAKALNEPYALMFIPEENVTYIL